MTGDEDDIRNLVQHQHKIIKVSVGLLPVAVAILLSNQICVDNVIIKM